MTTTPGIAASEGFDPAAFEELARLEAASFWFRARNRLILWALAEHFPEARSFMEVGCGTGFVLQAVRSAHPDMRLVGSELHEAALPYARQRLPGVELAQLDVRALPYREAFDVIGAFDVLEHVDDDAGALREIARALVPGGGLLVTVPQHPWLWGPADEFAHHERRYRRGELLARLRGAGLEPLRVTSFVSVLLPAMALARLRARRAGDRFDPWRELRLDRRLDAACERAMRAEQRLIARGVSLPAGGSLLVVARRAGSPAR